MPADAIFEPSYETGKPVRWRIWQPGEVPMGIAGIWTSWRDPADQTEHFSFAMLTVNANGQGPKQAGSFVLGKARYEAATTFPVC